MCTRRCEFKTERPVSANADSSDRQGGGGGTVLDAELGVDLFKMLVDGTLTEFENFSDVTV